MEEDAAFQPNVRSTASANYLQNMIHTPTLLELNLRLMDKRRQDREEEAAAAAPAARADNPHAEEDHTDNEEDELDNDHNEVGVPRHQQRQPGNPAMLHRTLTMVLDMLGDEFL